jgi:hypothetical protein
MLPFGYEYTCFCASVSVWEKIFSAGKRMKPAKIKKPTINLFINIEMKYLLIAFSVLLAYSLFYFKKQCFKKVCIKKTLLRQKSIIKLFPTVLKC